MSGPASPAAQPDRYTAADIVREYPELDEEDVYQAAKYGAWLASERTFQIG